MGTVRLTENCGNYQVWIGNYKDSPSESVKKFIEASRHYYKHNDLLIPVISEFDFSFAFFGRDDKGRVIRKDITGSDYLIEFDRSGKIVREGL